MGYEDTSLAVDKYLRADGSVTTLAGDMILPADEYRAREYTTRAASADKWLHPDGSVTDSAGHIILNSDASRARDYESRTPGMAMVPMTGDSTLGGQSGSDGTTPGDNGGTPPVETTSDSVAAPVSNITEGPSGAFLYSWLEAVDSNTISLTGILSVTDAGNAALT